MSIYFSKTTMGFYDDAIHIYDSIPKDAVEITEELRKELLLGQSTGKVISAKKNGQPILIDPPEPDNETKKQILQAEAKQYLLDTDWYYIRLAETGKPVPEDVVEKRKQARGSLE